MLEIGNRTRCAVCTWPLHTHAQGIACEVRATDASNTTARSSQLTQQRVTQLGLMLHKAAEALEDAAIDCRLRGSDSKQHHLNARAHELRRSVTELLSVARAYLAVNWTPTDRTLNVYQIELATTIKSALHPGCGTQLTDDDAHDIADVLLAKFTIKNRKTSLAATCAAAQTGVSPAAEAATCNYPRCNCPFDAPADPNWCARGLPKQPRSDR